MAVVRDIVESWRSPRVVVRRLLGRDRSEPFAFTLLATFLLLAFVAAAPNLAREAYLHPETPLVQRLYAAGLGLLATVPLWYLLAAIGHGIARAMGGAGNYYGGRIALFWAMVVIAPAMLLHGLVQGLLGPTAATNGLGLLVATGFLAFWIIMLHAVEA
jgi:hypothetical protein